MRVIAGLAKGRRLRSPGDATRPLTDRAKEALFSSLGGRLDGARVLDLFAGSGSLGLEALSRGAASAVFVERDRRALAALRDNVAAVALGGEVVADDVVRHVAAATASYDLVFVDPPWDHSLASVEELLTAVDGLLAAGATVVVHRRAGEDAPACPEGWSAANGRRYGDTVLWTYEREAPR